jgi:hypothetical protein
MKNRSGDTHNRLKPPISLQAQPPSNDCQFNPFLPILPLSVIGPSHLVPYPLYTYICNFTYVHPDDNATLKLYGITGYNDSHLFGSEE